MELDDDEQAWLKNGADSSTIDRVSLDQTYTATDDERASVTFTKLPEAAGSLTIKQLQLSEEQVEELGALSNLAYEITSNMEDGSFEYDLTLPNPQPEEEASVKYSEDGDSFEDVVGEVKENDVIKIAGLNHFTVFVVTSPNSQPNCDIVISGTIPNTTCFPTIQQAINIASDGDDIMVAAGTYPEYLSINSKSVNLIGSGASTTIIRSTTGGAVITLNTVTGPMTIEGFTIDADNSAGRSGIYIQNSSSDINVENNSIINFTDKGVLISNSNDNTVVNNTITGSSTGSHSGIYLDNQSGGNTIDGNTISLATSGTGLLYDILSTGANSKDNLIQNNIIDGGTRAYQQDGGVSGTVTFSGNTIGSTVAPSFSGVYLNGGSAVISGNTIKNAVRPIEFWGAVNVTITENILDGTTYDFINIGSFTGTLAPIQHNAFLNMGTAKLHNRTGNNVVAAENYWGDLDPSDNILNSGGGSIDYLPWWGANYVGDSHVTPWEWYVDTSESSAILQGIDAASDGDIINVAAGTYTDDIWDSSLGTPAGYRITKSITLLGAQAGNDPAGSTDRGGESILVRTNGLPYSLYAPNITIDGFMFGSSDPNTGGRLIISDNADNTIIKNCIIQNTPNSSSGHGVYIYAGADNALVEYNTFYNTAWEAIASTGASNAKISHNYISASGQHAIAWMGHSGSNVEISYNHISNIVGKNAIQHWGGPGANINNNEIIGSSTMFDGIWLDSAVDNSTINNNQISGLIYAGINVRDGNTGSVINFNHIYDNGTGLVNYDSNLLNAENNNWGVAGCPSIQTKINGDIDYLPYIYDGVTYSSCTPVSGTLALNPDVSNTILEPSSRPDIHATGTVNNLYPGAVLKRAIWNTDSNQWVRNWDTVTVNSGSFDEVLPISDCKRDDSICPTDAYGRPFPEGNYKTIFQAYDGSTVIGAVGTTEYFTIDNTAPAQPTGLKFWNAARDVVYQCGDYAQRQVNIPDWNDNVDSDFDHYEYSSFHPSGAQGLNESILTVSELNNSWMPPTEGAYGFSVRAVDHAGNKSAWSVSGETLAGSCQIIYDDTAPETPPGTPVPSPVSPTNQTTQIWTWTAAADLASGVKCYWYRIYDGASNVVASSFTTLTSITTNLTEGIYNFFVKAEDNVGNMGGEVMSASYEVDTTPPTTPDLVSPADGAIVKPVDALLDWTDETDTNEPVTYNYKSSWSGGGNYGPTSTGTTSQIDASGSSDRIYNWQVQACDSLNNCSAWSGPWEVTIDGTNPTDPTPTSTSHSVSSWSNDNTADVTWSGASDNLSGVDGFYTEWNTSTNTMVGPVTKEYEETDSAETSPILADGDSHYFHIATVDNAGNWTATEHLGPFYIDTVDPTSIITLPTNDGDSSVVYDNGWDGSIAGTATDDRSLVAGVELSIKRDSNGGEYWDGGTWVAGTETSTRVTATGTTSWTYSLSSPAQDIYTITSHAIDNAGNIEDSYSITIVFDKTIPEVALTMDPVDPDGDNGWYETNPEITLTATDDNDPNYGFKQLEHQWNSQTGTWIPSANASVSFNPPGEGHNILYYRALDKSDNYSTVGIKNIRYDSTTLDDGPQNISVSPNPTSGTTATVSWDTASDDITIDKYEIIWQLDGTSTQYSKSVNSTTFETEIDQLTEGKWNIKVKAFDGVGNSKEGNTTLTVDRSAPDAPTLALDSTGVGTANLSWNIIDDAKEYLIFYGTTSGDYIYGANVGNVTSYTVQGLGAGNYYFIVRAKDEADNQSGNSNEVNTGTIVGAPGTVPGGPAEGFIPAGEVQGVATEEISDVVTDLVNSEGEVMGTSDTISWFIFNLPWILLILQAAFILLADNLTRRNRSLLKYAITLLVTILAIIIFNWMVNPEIYSSGSLMILLAKGFTWISVGLAFLLKAFNYAFIEESAS